MRYRIAINNTFLVNDTVFYKTIAISYLKETTIEIIPIVDNKI